MRSEPEKHIKGKKKEFSAEIQKKFIASNFDILKNELNSMSNSPAKNSMNTAKKAMRGMGV